MTVGERENLFALQTKDTDRLIGRVLAGWLRFVHTECYYIVFIFFRLQMAKLMWSGSPIMRIFAIDRIIYKYLTDGSFYFISYMHIL